jgi:hypothetical protein
MAHKEINSYSNTIAYKNIADLMNLSGRWFDEWAGDLLEGATIMQSLMTTFIIAFIAIAAFGHVLLLQALFAPKQGMPKQDPAQADEQPSRDAPVAAARIAA